MRTILWDLDGTLLDTIDDLKDAVNYATSKYGYKPIDREKAKSYLGYGVVHLIQSATSLTSGPDFDDILQTFKEYYSQNCCVKTKPFDGIEQLVDLLKEKGYKQAIVSNKLDSMVQRIAKYYLGNKMDLVMGELTNVKKKPEPDMVVLACEKLGCKLEDVIYIGDSEVDVNTAKNSNVDCIAVSWGFRSRQQLIEAGASKIVDDIEQLKQEILCH